MPRIGVFVCHCGSNIGGTVQVQNVVEGARQLPYVCHAEANLYTCSEEGLTMIRDRIKTLGLDRVVVAACTPRTHEPLFKQACEEAGLNKYLFEFVNIREHCSWIHIKEPVEATRKALRLVAAGAAKAALLEAQEDTESDVLPSAIVLGGGIAGLSAASHLGRIGLEVHLVEKGDALGGMVRHLYSLFPTEQRPEEVLRPLIRAVRSSRNVNVHLESELTDLGGYAGNFTATLQKKNKKGKKGKGRTGTREEELAVGAIIVATGATELVPTGLFGYGTMGNVITQLELEARLHGSFKPPKRVVIITCAGARTRERVYCSRFCCLTALKNASRIKEKNSKADVWILHQDLVTCGIRAEQYSREVREAGVRFLRYAPESPPRVRGEGRVREVLLKSELSGKRIVLPADLVVLTPPLVGAGRNEKISRLLKVPLDQNGFFLEAHVKLRPVEFATDGIFLCGSARWPVEISEAAAQGLGAAGKAAALLRRGKLSAEAITAVVDPDKCEGCTTCVPNCPYSAITLERTKDRTVAKVNPVLCKGCGSCAVACPNGALQQSCYTNAQLVNMVESLLQED